MSPQLQTILLTSHGSKTTAKNDAEMSVSPIPPVDILIENKTKNTVQEEIGVIQNAQVVEP